jgi:arylsulfatase A-like enzyme
MSVAAPPLNIVMIVADDLGATDLGCFGSTFYETPRLDALAASGTKLTAAYSTCPVCSPTRASIMTGRYPQRTGITDYIGGGNQPDTWTRNTRLLPAPYAKRLSLKERTIAESLRDAGYETLLAGKWHLGNKRHLPTDQGFDVNKGGYNAGSPRSYFSPYKNPHLRDGPHGEHLPMRLADEACRFMAANADRPFFVCLMLYSVHVPLQAPPTLIEKYQAKATGLPSSGPESAREGNTQVRLVQNHPTYAAMVESMDSAVGVVLERLKRLELDDNTVIVFTSDNGGLATAQGRPTSNRPLRAGKGWLYEGGIRVPTIVRWPGVTKAGGVCETPMASVDYFPTFLQAAGRAAETQHPLDGVNIVPLLRGEAMADRPLFWHYPHYGNQGGRPGGAVRDGQWKLIEWYEDGAIELYDLAADPSETKNLADAQSDIATKMSKALATWRSEVGAKMPTVNPRHKAP